MTMRDAARQKALDTFGAALRSARQQQGLTQTRLGGASGLGRAHISRIEHGRCAPTFKTLMRLRHGLGSLADVFASCEDEM
jgi:transcriptional regulator with XRE-family HTH domain